MRAVRSLQVGIEDRVVIGKRHVFEPLGCDVFVECGPAAVVALETELPIKRATKDCIERCVDLLGRTVRNAISTIAVSSVSG